jgi:photosystem II stability/assembly factor-like uncharacterized protein
MPGRIWLRWVLVALCGLSWLISPTPASAQDIPPHWQPLGGPGGRITHLTAAPNGAELYAASVTGVNRHADQTQWYNTGNAFRSDALYRSGDGGATWQPVTNDLPLGPTTALYVDTTTGDLYVGVQRVDDTPTQRGGLWQSSDRGEHWQSLALDRAAPQAADILIRRVVHSGDGGAYLFVGATEVGEQPASIVYRSSDSGRTWAAFPALHAAQGPGNLMADLIPDPARADRLFITTYGGGLFVSNDTGQNWKTAIEPMNSPETSASPALLAFSLDTPDRALLIGGHNSSSAEALTVARSTDGGATWRTVAASGLPAGARARVLAAARGDVFLLHTTSGTYRSADGGTVWQPLEGALSSGGVAEFLALPGAENTVLAATGMGIFSSRDGGAVWQPFGTGLPFNSKIAGLLTHPARPEQILAVSDNRLPASSVQPPMILRSMDGGRRWTSAAAGLPDVPATAWALDPNDAATLFVASWSHIFRSTDAGLTWQVTRLDSSTRKAVAVAPSDSNAVYLGGRPALRSTDRGDSWQPMPVTGADQPSQAQDVAGLAVDPQVARHIWAALDGGGVYESSNAGQSWQLMGLAGRPISWLAASSPAGQADKLADKAQAAVTLYAGIAEDGIYRWDAASSDWTPAATGIPARSTILSFVADPRQPELLWATRDGGGIYRSTDRGDTWSNVGIGAGDNLALAMSVDYSASNGVLMGTATAGIWALRPNTQPTPSPRVTVQAPSASTVARAGADARIEVVWPHDWAPVTEARLANLGLRLFIPASLMPPACGWQPKVTVWEAANTDPAVPLAPAEQRSVDGQPFPFWELNDVDVSRATDPTQKLYFMVRVEGVNTATSVWAHGADPRTHFPQQDVPSGIASDPIDAVDARIQIVWPHDEAGNPRSVAEGTLANIAVTFFKHGTRLSVPVGWQPDGLTLFGAWNQEVGKPLAQQAVAYARQAGAITYPIWEFDNIPVARATVPSSVPADAASGSAPGSGSTVYLWVMADGVQTYPNIWAHGADSRTYFPAQDEPTQGCVP